MDSEGAVSMREALRTWASIGVNSFGGPAGQIAVMHREVVDRRKWVSENRFLHALNFCMVLPGPEAQQLATYLGWLMHGVRGGIAAGTLFIIPGFIVMLGLSIVYATYGSVTWVSGLLMGLQAAVVVLVIQAFRRIATRTLTSTPTRAIAAVAFAGTAFLSVPFPAVVILAGAIGWFAIGAGASPQVDVSKPTRGFHLDDDARVHPSRTRRAFWAASIFAALWAVPVLSLVVLLGTDNVFTQEALLFSKAALVTFGGAYAVLGYVAQQAVQRYGWISSADMATGLGLAESTPGPLIMVVQFVGFLAAYRHPGELNPLAAGVLGSIVTVWVTFVPCFLFIFLGAPFAEQLRENQHLAGALRAIAAAVCGVILTLGLWFAVHTVFASQLTLTWGPATISVPQWASVRWEMIAVIAVASVLIFVRKMATLKVLGVCAALGALLTVIAAR